MQRPNTPRARGNRHPSLKSPNADRPATHTAAVSSAARAAFGLQPLEQRVLMSVTGQSAVTPLLPSHDAFVRDGTYAAVNAGASAALVVKLDARNYVRQSYLSFDLASVAGNVGKAVLRLYGRYEGPNTLPVGAYGVPVPSWNESAINWNNQPATGAIALATKPVGGTLGWYEWDVTAYVKGVRAVGQSGVSLALKTTTYSKYMTVFSSEEATANEPQLVVTATVPPDETPAAPGGLSATLSGTRVSLAWQASAGATSYNLYRTPNAAPGQLMLAWAPYRSGLTGTSYVDTGAAPETTYQYAVSAVNGAGEGVESGTAVVTTGPATVMQQRPGVAPLAAAGLGVTVGGGQVVLPDGSVVAVQPRTLRFDAPEIRSHTKVGKTPNNYFTGLVDGVYWSQGMSLVPPVDTLMLGGLYKGVVPGSIVVRSADGSKTFTEGVHYRVNKDWGQVINLSSRLGASGSGNISVSYRYATQRLDLIQVLPDGTLSVKKGKPEVVTPALPTPDAGAAALAGIYVYTLDGARESNFTIAARDIFPINPAAPVAPINRGALSNTMSKLKTGQSVNIAWFGDSITAGAEAGNWWRDRSKTYTGLVLSALKKQFPSATVTETLAADGGLSTATAGPMFRNNVLNPDASGKTIDLLVIALGMNDTGKPSTAAFKSAMTNYIRQAKARGMDVLLVTTMPYNPLAEPFNPKYAPRATIAQATRELAAQEGVACADVYTEWMNLATRGVAPVSQIHNMINHPGVAGMKLYAATILRAFK